MNQKGNNMFESERENITQDDVLKGYTFHNDETIKNYMKWYGLSVQEALIRAGQFDFKMKHEKDWGGQDEDIA